MNPNNNCGGGRLPPCFPLSSNTGRRPSQLGQSFGASLMRSPLFNSPNTKDYTPKSPALVSPCSFGSCERPSRTSGPFGRPNPTPAPWNPYSPAAATTTMTNVVPRNPFPLRPPTNNRECNFCRNNGESSEYYRSHTLRNPCNGSLVCPVLRGHKCETCGATGDNAHTRNYCPLNRNQGGSSSRPLANELKCTLRQCNGQVRKYC
uniref:Nanos homolog 2 n=1 Tax=Caligus rogercresseyi TaxID=217165 RepID=C1BQI2_CALRO|nr:Nanos homolog 2 [Caligus rogercresseyi]